MLLFFFATIAGVCLGVLIFLYMNLEDILGTRPPKSTIDDLYSTKEPAMTDNPDRNIANIQKVIDRIKLDDGKHFRMESWVQYTPDTPVEDITDTADGYIDCKTAFCLGGTANLFRLEDEGVDWKALKGEEFAEQFSDHNAAGDWLGIDYGSAQALFFINGATGREAFDLRPASFRRAAGIAVMTLLRDTGYVDWKRACQIAADDLPFDGVPTAPASTQENPA